MEWVDLVELAGMNEAHEQVPDVSAMFGPEEERVFAVQNRSFQNLFAEGMPTA